MTGQPLLETLHDGIRVVRDDLIPGGTKARVLPSLLAPGREYVYASPAYGYAQVALAVACQAIGSRATVFLAKRAQPHPHTLEAHRLGATIVQVPSGYLSNVTAKARAYCHATGAWLLPFGFDSDDFLDRLAAEARMLPAPPEEVWAVAGSGTLIRALQRAWPGAAFNAVQIGKPPEIGSARLWVAPEHFAKDAVNPPPFPSCTNYDAKAWQFVREHAQPGALFWNVSS